MKKFIKNVLLSFVIIYTILNLVFYTFSIISNYHMINDVLTEYTGEYIDVETSTEIEENAKKSIEQMKDIYGENAPVTVLSLLQNYSMGINHIIDGQSTILIATLILSIAIGTIIYLKEESKMKEVLYFITIGIVYILICAGYLYICGEFNDINIVEAFIETLDIFGLWYVVGYVLVYVYRVYKYKKNVKQLNKELENKNK